MKSVDIHDTLTNRTPRRIDRFRIVLEQDETKDPDSHQWIRFVRVTLSVPLSEKYPDEKKAKQMFDPYDQGLDVSYPVKGMFLADETKLFSKALADVYKHPKGSGLKNGLTKLSMADLKSILVPLVEQGRDLFYRLFINIQPTNYSGVGATVVSNAIKSALSHYQIIYIESDVTLFPWAFLFYDPKYDSSKVSSIQPKNFWGFKHEIQESLKGTSQHLDVPANPTMVAAICSVEDQGWHNGPDHPFTQLENRNLLKRTPSTVELGKALNNFNEDCFYFFGHADHSDPPIPSQSFLQLRSQQLTVVKLQQDFGTAPSFNKDLVVALFNGCKTAPLNYWDERTMIGFLCLNKGHNRLCCVSTVGQIPAVFAGVFAKHFWTRFLVNRDPIGWALLKARRKMLAQWRNPLGLLYSLFGRVDAQVEDCQETDDNGSDL